MSTPSLRPVLLLAALAATLAAAGGPAIRTTPAQPGEIGWRPADGETVRLNPPSFLWPHEQAAATYDVQWDRDPAFPAPAGATGFVWNTYTHHAPLPAGTYAWRYRFTTAAGLTSSWSATRAVTVPPDAAPFPLPSRAQQRDRVPAGHPRLFLRPEDLPRLRAAASGPQRDAFAAVRRAADQAIAAGPTPEPEHMGSATDKDNDEWIKHWWPNREQTLKACEEAEAIAFMALLTGEEKYRAAARRWIRHLAGWDPDGPTNMRMNCEAAKPLLYRLPRAYDWAWDALSEEDRAAVQRVMVRRVADAWKSGEIAGGTGHFTRPFNSHGNRIWHKVGEAGIALLGEVPEAETWLDYAVNKFHACYPVWADDDGGWHEGVSYWSGYLSKSVWWLQVAQSALGLDGLRKPFFAQIGDYPLYVAPPHSPTGGFGDLSHRPPSAASAPFLEYYARALGAQPGGARAGYWRWWAEQYQTRPTGGWLGFLYQANLPPLPPARPPSDLPVSKVFHGIGVASLHTTLLDSRDDVHLLFKSSPFGSQSHGHQPQNSFQLDAYGEALLVANTYRDLHGSKFHYRWVHSTIAQNAVLVNGTGQVPHAASSTGRIVAERLTPDWDFVVGDARDAYAGRLTRALRTALLVRRPQPFVVLVDDLAAPEPATFQFLLHALRAFEVDAEAGALRVSAEKAGVDIRYLGPPPVRFRQWDGYDPPPRRPFPNQWHVEAGTVDPARELRMVTVLVPYRAGSRPDWSAVRTDGAATELTVTLAGQAVRVRLGEPGAEPTIRFP